MPLAETSERDFLNGPGFADWLEARDPELYVEGGDSLRRAVNRWKKGAQPNYYEIDRQYLMKLGIYEWEIPDDLWERKKKFKKSAKRVEAEEMLRQGFLVPEIHKHFLERDEWVPTGSLRKWRRQLDTEDKVVE